MKKFEFRLASVLRLRETRLAAEKIKLQELLAERERLQKSLDSYEKEQKEALAWVQNTQDANSADLRALSAFLLGSKARRTTAQQALESCALDIQEQRVRLMQAERNQKLLLKLKDKRLASWQYDADRELELIAQEAWQSAARKSQSTTGERR
jgi:flagellar export protein FliJ